VSVNDRHSGTVLVRRESLEEPPAIVPLTDEADRRQSDRLVGKYLATSGECGVWSRRRLQCRAFESPLASCGCAFRRSWSHLVEPARYLYNMLEYLSEPDPWEQTLVKGYRASRPKTSSARRMCSIIIGLGSDSRGGFLRLQRAASDFNSDHLTSEYNRKGSLVPLPGSMFPQQNTKGLRIIFR